jgi:hypothetical protein
MPTNRSTALAYCAIVACAASACSRPILPFPRAASLSVGEWNGTTSQGMPIAFSVSEDEMVTTITLGHRFNGCSGSETFSDLNVRSAPDLTCIPGPCSGRLASYRAFGFADGPSSGPRTQINGLFLPGDRAQGQASFFDYHGCGNATVEWSATRR